VAPEVRENLYDESFAARGVEAVTPATVPTTGAEPITTYGDETNVSIWLPTTAAVAEDSVAEKRFGCSSTAMARQASRW